MIGHGEKLSRKQDQVITALVTCASITEAAAQCGLADVTLRRWLKQEPFQAAYREARRAVVQHAITQVQRATGEAVETLRTVMRTPRPRQALVSLRRRRCSRRPSTASKLRVWQPALLPSKRKGHPDEPAAAVGPRPGAGRADGGGECTLSGMGGAITRRSRRFACCRRLCGWCGAGETVRPRRVHCGPSGTPLASAACPARLLTSTRHGMSPIISPQAASRAGPIHRRRGASWGGFGVGLVCPKNHRCPQGQKTHVTSRS